MCTLSGGVAASAAAPAARRGDSSLEYSQNVVTEQPEQSRTFEIASCGCDCWYCADCCKRKGYNLRAELIPVLRTFTGLMMLTLTVDPLLFPSPRAAYLYIRDKRALSRLMQDLDRGDCVHTRRYFYVVEFQQKTEQAHFHVLVDASFIPKSRIDIAWNKLRPRDAGPVPSNRPPFGMTRFSVDRFAGGPEHAGRYATKYLVKTPEHGWPAWVMSMGASTRVPRYGTSRGFWGRPRKPPTEAESKRERIGRTYAERIADCGTTTNIFACADAIDPQTGEEVIARTWRCRADASLTELKGLGVPAGPRQVRLQAPHLMGCLEAMSAVAGHEVRIVGRERPIGGAH